MRALQCLLQERGFYGGKLSGNYNAATIAAVQAWQESRGFAVSTTWSPANWVGAFAQGRDYAQKVGSTGLHVRRVQRALNAADPSLQRAVDGIFNRRTATERARLPAPGRPLGHRHRQQGHLGAVARWSVLTVTVSRPEDRPAARCR